MSGSGAAGRYLGTISKNARSEYRIFERTDHGAPAIELRIYEQDGKREMRPTPRRFTLRREALSQIAALLDERDPQSSSSQLA